MSSQENQKPQQTAEEVYENAHVEAKDLLERIGELLEDLPAPGDDEHPIHWGHVGNLQEVQRRLASVVAFLEGKER